MNYCRYNVLRTSRYLVYLINTVLIQTFIPEVIEYSRKYSVPHTSKSTFTLYRNKDRL